MIQFLQKPQIAQINKQAATYSYNYATAKFENFEQTLTGTTKEPDTILVQGHYGTSIGKMVCGCRFQSYYPITPASDESVFLESNEILNVQNDRPGSTAVIQTEDEICAMGMMIGSALTGTSSATCTSGPGFALMTEMLGWAGINEVPVVITNYQRSGPINWTCQQDMDKTIYFLQFLQDMEIFQKLFMLLVILKKVSMILEMF